uniref:Predicted protein n=1 Tax=Physcomitrium patens TaxID=3218 RepID=A9U7A4_PHYPA
MFMTGVGMSQIAPVLPLFIKQLGVENASWISQLSGVAFGVTYIISAIFSPIWGRAADKYGRKPMLLRASLGMAIVIGCMGFAPNVYWLIGLRLLQGVITGYGTACTTLIATQTSKEHSGWALGTLSTANIAGSLLGPLIGGLIEEHFGMREHFLHHGWLRVHRLPDDLILRERDVRPYGKKGAELQGSLGSSSAAKLKDHLVLDVLRNVDRHVFGPTGAYGLCRSNRAKSGPCILFIPQAFVHNPWELMALRFLLGLAAGGLNPSVNVLLKKITPSNLTGRVFGLNMSAAYLGVFGGSVLGGQIAGHLGVRYVFLVTGALLLMNAIWVYFKVYGKLQREKLLE